MREDSLAIRSYCVHSHSSDPHDAFFFHRLTRSKSPRVFISSRSGRVLQGTLDYLIRPGDREL